MMDWQGAEREMQSPEMCWEDSYGSNSHPKQGQRTGKSCSLSPKASLLFSFCPPAHSCEL